MPAATDKVKIAAAEARAFLEFLDPDAVGLALPFAFQTYDDNKSRADKAGARTYIGTIDQQGGKLAAANRAGYAVHVTINDTAGEARTAANVCRVRKHFVEIDGTMRRDRIAKLAETIGLKIAWINELSPGKYHVYFNVADDAARDLAGFTRRQKQLAKVFNGGPESVDLPRVLRVPGFWHQKGKPFQVRCVYQDANAPAHSIADFERALAGIEVDEAPNNAERDAPANDEDQAAVIAAIEHFKTYPPAISDTPNGPLGKKGNSTTFDAMVIAKDIGLDEATCLELALDHYNPRCSPGWGFDELKTIVRNAYEYGKNPQGSKHPSAEFKADPIDDNTINAAIVADMTWRAKKSRLQSSTAAARGIGDNSRGALSILDADKITARNIDMIWPDRLARGKHTAMAGLGGKGKSQLLYDIAARITKGAAWPDGGRAPKGTVIILSAEDGPADVMVPRLIAAGADLKYVKIVKATRDDKGGEHKFSLQTDLEKLRTLCEQINRIPNMPPVMLIGFDPVSSYMGGDLDTHRNSAVRSVLDPLTQLAEDVQCAVLSISHFNKGSNQQAINRVMESAAFVNAPRASFGVFDDPDDIATEFEAAPWRLFLPLKTNIGKMAAGLRYRIEEATAGKDDRTGKPIITSRIVWGGKVSLTADEVVRLESERSAPRLDEAASFLREYLADGPKPAAEVREQADARGITEDTLRRAREKIGIVSATIKGKPRGGNEWSLRREVELDPVPDVAAPPTATGRVIDEQQDA